ncbi:hypothetical protein MRB53_012512 [Persea americana]|uniref:Uncharacterized protein n=1 Tax=Persea americana TaxID=3435 RepID=A0ACC2LY01_PERAE|nr:hypothetical protein MRB53_012512 [Persea americana]
MERVVEGLVEEGEDMMTTAFTSKKDNGREEKAIQCPPCKRTLHSLQPVETTNLFSDKSNCLVQVETAEQA